MMQTREVTCNNCGTADGEPIAGGRDFEYQSSDLEFTVVRCRQCGLVYLNPRPDESELWRIYPQEYLSYAMVEEDIENEDAWAHRLRRHFYTGKFRHALKYLDPPGGADLDFLDVGAGDGRLLNWYKKIPSVKLNTYAIEINRGAAEILRRQGHVTYEGLFPDMEVPKRSFDIVHSSHVIEHVADPKAFSHESHRLLKPGGLYLVETPNYDCLDARFFRGRYWGGYHFPRHWTFYTPETLIASLEEVGLEVLEVRFFPNPVFWVWTMHHILKEKGFPALLWRRFPVVEVFNNSFSNVIRLGVFTLVDRMLSLFNRGRMGSMQIIAQKPALP